ncbi:urease accessory protein UreD [uncultured Methylibium sp.]|uniref:urease accessory protein UreD n=1 Tax=uncultured Methylibium sp. TaxID=381093 RepID=UPI0025F7C2D5|nr:urease accessory protein UreD [uncultured Methylibium sp.]
MSWAGRLELRYRSEDWRDGGRRSVRHDRHDGPLRVLASLYPEAPAVCHDVLVHPPGGIAGGDTLDLDIDVAEGAHALLTTPGATRFYRSGGAPALQTVDARLAPGARLEWLPLEAIVHSGALAENRLRFTLAPGAEMIGWDLLALGLPAAGQAFERGRYLQHLELPGRWLERGLVDAADARLLDSPLGWDGQRVLGMLWFAAGGALEATRVEALLDAAREPAATSPLAARAGATSPHEGVVVLRVLAPRVEPAMQLLAAVWARWREIAWGLAACAPRVWKT